MPKSARNRKAFDGLVNPKAPSATPKRIWRRHLWWFVVVCVVAIGADAAAVWANRPWPNPSGVVRSLAYADPPATLAWPVTASAAVGAVGYGVLADSGTETPQPTASTAKLITALVVLERHPLAPGQPGPTLTMAAADVASYIQYVAEDGSSVPVSVGEQLSEFQALEALLIPSADNIADTLATWAYGSVPNYLVAANQFTGSLGMTQTVVAGDASGFLPTTESTPADLVLLGQAAMANPVLAQIVAEKAVTLPDGGVFKTSDHALGLGGIDGVKTGNTSQAGGVFVFSAPFKVGTTTLRMVGAIMGADNLPEAFPEAVTLLASAEAGFALATPVPAGQVVASYRVPWGPSVRVVTQNSLSVFVWRGTPIVPAVTLGSVYAPLAAGSVVGTLVLTAGSEVVTTRLKTASAIARPPNWYHGLFLHR